MAEMACALWGGPPGPRLTPPSACSQPGKVGLNREGGSGGTRADRGVRPTIWLDWQLAEVPNG